MPDFSLIVPTRGRPEQLRRFLASVATTVQRPEAVEVVLVVDADDPASLQIPGDGLRLRHVVVPPGQTMGALNAAGYDASTGRYVMLLNDDVIVRTLGWDAKIRACFRAFSDEILLVHVNDTVFQKALCTFPIVSRRFCELAGGICPPEYVRYRIDDHIEDAFNLLGVLGARRSLYLPQVIFEHENFVTNAAGVRQYFSQPQTLAQDAARFDELNGQRKVLALRLMNHIHPRATERQSDAWRTRLDAVTDSPSLRVPERLCVLENSALTSAAQVRFALSRAGGIVNGAAGILRRASACYRERGVRGIFRALARRLGRLFKPTAASAPAEA
jgi:hypothetical protein